MKTMPDNQILTTVVSRIDPFRIVIVAVLMICALFVWSFARDRIVAPVDELVTEQLCITYGEEVEREVIGFERSNRFGIFNRSEGFCRYGQGPNGEAPISVTIEDTAPGPLYRGAKIIGIITQLGIASIFLRFTMDPSLDFYRWVRSRLPGGNNSRPKSQ